MNVFERRLPLEFPGADLGGDLFQAARDGARSQITLGDELGVLEVSVPDIGEYTFPLIATESVAAAGFITRFGAAFEHLKSQVLSAL